MLVRVKALWGENKIATLTDRHNGKREKEEKKKRNQPFTSDFSPSWSVLKLQLVQGGD